jgi:hypothetical protein
VIHNTEREGLARCLLACKGGDNDRFKPKSELGLAAMTVTVILVLYARS